ncbi:MAG: hypothetical protein AAF517_19195 [Planctomycetota bacterium]
MFSTTKTKSSANRGVGFALLIGFVAQLGARLPAQITVEVFTNRADFEARLGETRAIDFEDVDTEAEDPREISPDRYVESHGIRIRGEQGQFIGRTFENPDDFPASSGVNVYASGPAVPSDGSQGVGDSTTDVIFHAGEGRALVAGFGVMFIDADVRTDAYASGFSVFGRHGRLLGSTGRVLGSNAEQLFRGVVTVDTKTGEPVASIARAQISAGQGWPAALRTEGVVLDDFVFGVPVAMESGTTFEVYSDPALFASRAGETRQIDFDDVSTEGGPSPFEPDRYATGTGMVIRGAEGQFAGRTFGHDDFPPPSAPNTYAPGPAVPTDGTAGPGGNTTDVVFRSGNREAVTSGFGAKFVDADRPDLRPTFMRVFGERGELLGASGIIRGQDSRAVFRGILVVDARTNVPVKHIAQVELVTGAGWPGLRDGSEVVTLDDFVTALPAPPSTRFIRGDSSGDGLVNITDAVSILGFLFLGDDPGSCEESFDQDDNGAVNLTDAIGLLNWLFLGGLPPREPFPGCGVDSETMDAIDCEAYPPCDAA